LAKLGRESMAAEKGAELEGKIVVQQLKMSCLWKVRI